MGESLCSGCLPRRRAPDGQVRSRRRGLPARRARNCFAHLTAGRAGRTDDLPAMRASISHPNPNRTKKESALARDLRARSEAPNRSLQAEATPSDLWLTTRQMHQFAGFPLYPDQRRPSLTLAARDLGQSGREFRPLRLLLRTCPPTRQLTARPWYRLAPAATPVRCQQQQRPTEKLDFATPDLPCRHLGLWRRCHSGHVRVGRPGEGFDRRRQHSNATCRKWRATYKI